MDGDGGSSPVLVGRSSSHFTRTARLFALELAVSHRFQPVLDIGSADPATFAGNPALKVPIWLDEHGPLYGTENICRELAHRSGHRERAVLRGDVGDRLVANAEELVLHAMSSAVTLIMTAAAGAESPAPPKVRPSLINALGFLERHLDAVLAALPARRLVSFFEVALYCLVRHLPFRQVLDPTGYDRLQAFCREIDPRPAAQATSYRFDV